jgi:hypothetical protein
MFCSAWRDAEGIPLTREHDATDRGAREELGVREHVVGEQGVRELGARERCIRESGAGGLSVWPAGVRDRDIKESGVMCREDRAPLIEPSGKAIDTCAARTTETCANVTRRQSMETPLKNNNSASRTTAREVAHFGLICGYVA